jgi:hypothetical protein
MFAFFNALVVLVNMFIAIIMENFETAEEEKRQRQVQDYLRKNDVMTMEDAPIGSRWNVFRYLKPKPKSLAVDNMPSSLVLSTHKEYVRDFLLDSSKANPWLANQVSYRHPVFTRHMYANNIVALHCSQVQLNFQMTTHPCIKLTTRVLLIIHGRA